MAVANLSPGHEARGRPERRLAPGRVLKLASVRSHSRLETHMKVAGLFRNAQATVNVAAGGVVFREGEEADTMFGIVEGEITLYTTSRVVATLGPDDIFGEM